MYIWYIYIGNYDNRYTNLKALLMPQIEDNWVIQ